MIWWALLLACRRPAPPEMLTADERVAEVGTVREPFVGPARWQGLNDLCLDVPEGWSGTQGAAPLLLEIAHEQSSAVLTINAWPWGTPVPRVLEPQELVFHDLDSHRAVPLLRPSATYTLIDLEGALTQGWYADIEGRVLVVDVRGDFGRTTEARAAAQPLLSGLARCGLSRGGGGVGGR